MQVISIVISAVSFLFGFIIMFGCYLMYGKRAILEGAPGWILAIAGAPTTFLLWIVNRIGMDNSIILQYMWVCFFYLLQYQAIGLFIFILYKKKIALLSSKSIIYFSTIFLIIIFSGILMSRIILPKP